VLIEGGGKKRRTEQVEIDNSAGAFGQFQATSLDGPGEMMLNADSPLDVGDAELQWLQKRSDREKELFELCKLANPKATPN
jgi:hypothetical protein